jgi:excisionase family DNA binding protein
MSIQPPNDSPLAGTITVAVAARILKTDPRVIRNLIDELEIRAYHIGNRWRVVRTSLLDYIGRQSNLSLLGHGSGRDDPRRTSE